MAVPRHVCRQPQDEESPIALTEFLPEEDNSNMSSAPAVSDHEAVSEAGNNEASLKLYASAAEANENNISSNKSNFFGPTHLSIPILVMLTVIIV